MPRRSNLVFVATLIVVLLALAVDGNRVIAQDATPCPALTEASAHAWVEGYYAAWNAHDAAATAAFMAPGYVHHWGIGDDATGRDAFQQSLEAFLAVFPNLQATVDRVWVAGDTVVIRWIDTGVQTQDFMGVPASQTSVTWTGISIFQLACDQAIEGWTEADHFGRVQQQGAIPVATPSA